MSCLNNTDNSAGQASTIKPASAAAESKSHSEETSNTQTCPKTPERDPRPREAPGVARFPHSHSKLIGEMMGKSILNIAPNPPETIPVPYKNFKRGRSDFCRLTTIDGPETPWWLIWYFMEFIGHLEYLDKNFETFRDVICERENPAATGKNDFTNYLSSLITDSKSVYNKHLYIHFQVMWEQCSPDREAAWNQKLGDLREAFNRYIIKIHLLVLLWGHFHLNLMLVTYIVLLLILCIVDNQLFSLGPINHLER